MRVGATLSAAAHAGAIALALWALPWFRVRPEPPEAVQVRLVSPGELAALSPAPAVPAAAPVPAAPASPPVAVAPPPIEDSYSAGGAGPGAGFDADAPLGIAAEGALAPQADAAAPAFGLAAPADPAASVFGTAPLRGPSPLASPEDAAPVEVIVQPDPAAPEAAPSPTTLARSTPPPRRPGDAAPAAVTEPAAPEPAAASDPEAAERGRFQAAVAAAIERARADQATGDRAVGGAARLEVGVARDGRLLQARLVGSSGSPLLDRAALAAARQARLPPAPADLPGESFRFEIGVSYPLPDG